MHIAFSPYLHKIYKFNEIYKFSPYFCKIYVFGLIYVFLLPPILTMMHLRIMHYTYCTSLSAQFHSYSLLHC